MSSLVLSDAHKLKDNPFIYGDEQNETQIYIEQMHSPLVTQKRKEMLIKRCKLRQKHPDWEIIMKYPARLFKHNENGDLSQLKNIDI